ncbi:hypothetical protein OV450_1415 [Actinobacteria bacterium OV450]|nr:hypothetical protein OV450_1415 [Actinobacteria bacterium OV450]
MTASSRTARPQARRGPLARLLLGKPVVIPPGAYRYRCGVCRTTFGPAASHAAVVALRTGHRADKHGGGAPDSEEITSPAPLSPFTVLGAYRPMFERVLVAVGIVAFLILLIASW